jgi:hypothetical protein
VEFLGKLLCQYCGYNHIMQVSVKCKCCGMWMGGIEIMIMKKEMLVVLNAGRVASRSRVCV